jgi:hypothetical protein
MSALSYPISGAALTELAAGGAYYPLAGAPEDPWTLKKETLMRALLLKILVS